MIILSQKTSGYCCGGKANNLFILKALGLNVPPFIVIPQEVLHEILNNSNDEKSTLLNFTITDSVIKTITDHFPNTIYFAVRSSAVEEDGNEHSFAGQFETFLYVTKQQLAEKIKLVWLSSFSNRVQHYRLNNNLNAHNGIAIIIQVMIDAEVAGVAFGINPITGNRKEKIISSVYGLGEGLVSGDLNADTFTVDTNNTIIKDLVKKTHQIKFDNNKLSGTIKTPVPNAYIEKESLNADQILKLVQLLETLFSNYKTYQDIEFAFKDNKLYILQTRPITSMHQLADSNGDHIIWDNSNIIESYPGVSTPLTFSFVLKVYESVYRQFVQMMGVSLKDIEHNKETFANMLGFINGRIYYNLLSWYKALAMLPGYSINAEFMEKMMGVKEKFQLTDTLKRSKFKERLRVINMVRVLLKNLKSLPKMRETFVKDFNTTMQEYNGIQYSKKNAGELMRLYLNFEHTLLKKWKAPLVNDFFAMIYFGILQKLVVKYNIDSNGTIQNDLLCGAKDIISTEPIHRCLQLADAIQKNECTKNIFIEKTAAELYELHKTKKLNAEISILINEYLNKFGNRCVGELKLETITYLQNPVAFIKIIKAYVEQGITLKNTPSNLDAELKHGAETKVSAILKNKPLKKIVFNYFLKRARVLVSARENLRYERTRAFGVVRELFCNIGTVFFAEGVLQHPRDIFFLTKEEIFDYIKGTTVNFNLKELITLRKKQFAAFENKQPFERIHTRGIVYVGNDFFTKRTMQKLQGDLKGLGCCPGRVRAKVQVVNDPEEIKNLNGDILVTSSTDPGWVTLFPTASGILVERGSLLSHSAIVSREMGKPCIVGITGLLERLKTGDEVEMDGATGEIKIIIQ